MGERFGRYRLGASLGGGGLGEVREARWLDGAARPPGAPAGPLAVKRLHLEHLARPELVAAFRVECGHARRFDHPHLARAFDHGDAGGVPFLAMARAGDATLAARPLPRGAIAAACRALAGALECMHRAGYVHADVSPRNIVVAADGAVTLVDYGSTVELGGPRGRPIGTYGYMAPEQARGDRLTGAADQFALATVLWEQLAGRRLFRRPEQHLTLVAVVEDDPPPLERPELERAERVLRRALAKPRELRYESCATFAEALAEALAELDPAS